MSTATAPPTTAPPAAAPPVSRAPTAVPVLRRQCACGGTPGSDGECAACRKRRLQRRLQRRPSPSSARGGEHGVATGAEEQGAEEQGAGKAERPRTTGPGSRLAPRLQFRLVIGEPNDRYEEEADRVAARVMDAGAGAAGPDAAGAARTVQRNVRPREEDDEELSPITKSIDVGVRRSVRPAAMPAAADEETSRKSDPARTTTVDESALTVGGESLPASTRGFYEPRFGRDFRHVRVHQGMQAERFTDALHAEAFAYGEHLWLGRGVGVDPSFTLAHELAHVVQQTQPRVVAPRAIPGGERDEAPEGAAPVDGAPAARAVQRFTPYWEPYNYNGEKNHSKVLPELGKLNSLFTEAPVPNADKLGVADDKKGLADMYSAATTVGVYFAGHELPESLESSRKLKKDGARFGHSTKAAPRVTERMFEKVVIDADKAPTSIKIGDLKPTHGTIEALEGPEQVQNYLDGFKKARDDVNALPGPRRDEKSWPAFTARDFLTATDVSNLGQFAFPTAAGQDSTTIILKQASKPVPKTPKVKGKLYVHPDPSNKGIWNYFWLPDKPVTGAKFPASIRTIAADIQTRVVEPLLASPVKPAGKRRPGSAPPVHHPALSQASAHAPGGASAADPAPAQAAAPVQASSPDRAPSPEPGDAPGLEPTRRRVSRRKKKTTKPPADPFVLKTWKAAHKEVTDKLKAQESGQDFADARTLTYSIEAQEKVREETGLSLPGLPTGARGAARDFRKMEFWTGGSSAIFGPLREVFGTAFVKVAGLYIKVRDRFQKMLKKKGGGKKKGGFVGAAVTAVFSALKLALSFVVGETAERLLTSLQEGVSKKLQTLLNPTDLLDPDRQEELQAKIEELKALQAKLEETALKSIESLVEMTIGPWAKTLEQLEDVQKLVSNFTTIVNLVRWGARVVACLAPPGWGCLWILVQSLLEAAAAKVAETCWFQKKITPHLSGISFIANMPATLADLIVKQLKSVLPASLHDVFADIDTSAVTVRASDIDCDESKDGKSGMTPERRALLELIEAVGDDRYEAFAAMVEKWGIKSDTPLTVEQINKLKKTILDSGVTTEELKQMAQTDPSMYGESLKKKVVGMTEFLDEVKAGAATRLPGGTGEGEGEGEGGGGEGDGDGGGKGGIVAKPAASPTGAEFGGKTHVPQVVGGVGRGDYRGHAVKVTLLLNVQGHSIYLQEVEAVIGERIFKPSESNAETLTVEVKITKTQEFDISEYKRQGLITISALRVNAGSMWHYTIQLRAPAGAGAP